MLLRHQVRKGTTIMECAVIFPALFLLVIGVIVGGLGVFRYQEVAALAREASRWASVRGWSYELATGEAAATEKDIYEKVIQPKAVGFDKNKLKYKVTWNPDNRQGSTVTVQITYQWIPEAFIGSIDLKSSSTTLISF